MDHRIETVRREQRIQRSRVVQVDDVQSPLGDVVRVAFAQIVQHLDVVPFFQQKPGGVRADITGASGDKNLGHGRESREAGRTGAAPLQRTRPSADSAFQSAFSMAAISSGASGFTPGSNLPITLPSLPTRNFVKFHFTSPPAADVRY